MNKAKFLSDEWTALNPLKAAATVAAGVILAIVTVVGGIVGGVWFLFTMVQIWFAAPILIATIVFGALCIGLYHQIKEDKDLQKIRNDAKIRIEKEKAEKKAAAEAKAKEIAERKQWEIPK